MPLKMIVRVPLAMKGWRQLLGEWGRMMDRWPTVPRNDRDVPYWYGERPLTGLLATAAWRIGGFALEESEAARGPASKPRAGRIDSWIYLRGKWYQIEAKVTWPRNARNPKAAMKNVASALAKAKKQLNEIKTPALQGDHAIALCYVVPQLTEASVSRAVEMHKELADRLGHRIVALYTPPAKAKHFTERRVRRHYVRRHYPWLLLVGQKVW